MSNGTVEGKELCNLAEGYSFILQSVLGVLAFSTLICKNFVCGWAPRTEYAVFSVVKRYREPVLQRRPFWIWLVILM